MLEQIIKAIQQECRLNLDPYSQDVLIAHIDLLLTYSNRFYNQQFITRNHVNNNLMLRLEILLTDYIKSDKIKEAGLPTVRYVANQLNISPN